MASATAIATPFRATAQPRQAMRTPSASVRGKQQQQQQSGKDPLSVVLRVRPFTLAEVRNGERTPCVNVEGDTTVLIAKPSSSAQQPERYTFSTVYGPTVTQQQLFKRTIAPLVSAFVQGTPALVFAYGVTNAGKTYTVTGPSSDPGVVPRVVDTLFRVLHRHSPDHYPPVPSTGRQQAQMQQQQHHHQQQPSQCSVRSFACSDLDVSQSEFAVSVSSGGSDGLSSTPSSEDAAAAAECDEQQFAEQLCAMLDPGCNCELSMSYLEVYNDCVYDLLVPRPASSAQQQQQQQQPREQLAIIEDRARGQTVVPKLRWASVANAAEARVLISQGGANRTSAGTSLNSESSRSHAVLSIALVQYPRGCSLKALEAQNPQLIRVNHFMVVDLAGSERAQRTQNTGAQLQQASNINNSLMTFRRCVDALRWNQRNPRNERPVPFRDCKLTRLLHDFFAGTKPSRAVMIANVSPSPADHAETHAVLQFSSLARELLTNSSAVAGQPLSLAARQLLGAPHDALVAEVERLRQALQDAEADRVTMEVDLRAAIVSEMMFLSAERDATARLMCAAEVEAVEFAGMRKAAAVRAFDDERYAALAGELDTVRKQMATLMRECMETTQAAANARKDAPAKEQLIAELQSRNRALVAKLEAKIEESRMAAASAAQELQREKTAHDSDRATVAQLQSQLQEAVAKLKEQEALADKMQQQQQQQPVAPSRESDVEFADQPEPPTTPSSSAVVVDVVTAPLLPPALHPQSPVPAKATPLRTPPRTGGLAGRLLRVFSAKKPSPKRKSKERADGTPSKKKLKKHQPAEAMALDEPEPVDENKMLADTQLLPRPTPLKQPAAVVVASNTPVASPAQPARSHRRHPTRAAAAAAAAKLNAAAAASAEVSPIPAKKKRAVRRVVDDVEAVPRTPMRLRSGRKLV